MSRALAVLIVASSIVGSVSIAHAQHAMIDDKELMTKLKDAAPARILEHATVLNMGPDGKMKVVKQGDNGWTCMDPGGAPMCADKAAMEWAEAWQSKGPAPQKLGFIYMLSGEDGATRDDRGRRSQGHDAGLPKGRESRRPQSALRHVARDTVRTSDVADKVTAILASGRPPNCGRDA